MRHESKSFLPWGLGGKRMLSELANRGLHSRFSTSPSVCFGLNQHPASPVHINYHSYLTVVLVGFLGPLPGSGTNGGN